MSSVAAAITRAVRKRASLYVEAGGVVSTVLRR
jgi:hypothetical protein